MDEVKNKNLTQKTSCSAVLPRSKCHLPVEDSASEQAKVIRLELQRLSRTDIDFGEERDEWMNEVAFSILNKHSDFNKLSLSERKAPSILKLEGINTQNLRGFYSLYSQRSAHFASWVSRNVKCGGLHDQYVVRSSWASDQQWATEGYVLVREEMLTFEIKRLGVGGGFRKLSWSEIT